MFCPHCEEEHEVNKITKKETLPVMGEPVEYDAEVYKCAVCNKEFATTAMEEENFRKAYDIYRDRHHLLRPERIREIREKYGLGQKDFSRFLGWGEITIHRYESGSLQDIVHNEALLLTENPYNAAKIFELNKDRLAPNVVQRLENKIKELQIAEKGIFVLPLLIQEDSEATIETGYKAFDIEKIENLILYIAEKCGGVLKTKLNKLLWYADFKYFKDNVVGITGVRYEHLPYGPVPKNYELLTWKLEQESRLESQEQIFGDYSGELYIARDKANSNLFSEHEIRTIDLIIQKLGHLGSTAISELSHKEAAYKLTSHKEIIPYSFAKDLSL